MHSLAPVLWQVIGLRPLPLAAPAPTPPVWAALLGGAGLGLLWGLAARLWMRLISTHPEFSWGGTAAILLIATLFGASVGLAWVARRRGWSRWGHYAPRTLVVIFFLPFGLAGGTPLMLTVLVAALAATRAGVLGIWALALCALFFSEVTIGGGRTLRPWLMGMALALTVGHGVAWLGRERLTPALVWLNRLLRTLLGLAAVGGFGSVAFSLFSDHPGPLAFLYLLFYWLLLCPLFLGLRVGLQARTAP